MTDKKCIHCGLPEGEHQWVTGRCPVPVTPPAPKWGRTRFKDRVDPKLCPYCARPVNYFNYHEHLYMNCLDQE